MSKLKKRVVYAGDVLNGLMLKGWTPMEAAELLQGLPEANPVAFVPVVRCRECVHAKNANVNDRGFRICPASHMEIMDDDFCSYGERQRMPEAGLNPSEVNIEKPGQRLIDANGLIQKAGPILMLDMLDVIDLAPTIEAIFVKENEENLRKLLKDRASFDDLEKRQERKEG